MRVVIGRLARPHGIRGELSIELRTDEPERRFAVGSSVVCGQQTLTISAMRFHGTRLIIQTEEIADRTAAEAITGQLIEMDVDANHRPDDVHEYYDYQLRGLRVESDGYHVGTIAAIEHGTHQDTLLIDTQLPDSAPRQVLVPFVAALVPAVDLDAGTVHIADIDGLLNPDAAQDG